MTDPLEIKAFAFDVDGVLTDGGVFCNLEGQLLRTFDAKDGFALRMAAMNGYPLAIITGGRSESIRKRVITSGLKPEDVYLGSRDKMADLRDSAGVIPLSPRMLCFSATTFRMPKS